MAKKKVDAQAELDKEPSRKPEPEAEPRKAAGRTIGAWRKDALKYLGKGASDSDVTQHILKIAKDNGYEYSTDDAETAEWRSRVQAELDGTSAPTTPRSGRSAPTQAGPTLDDMLSALAKLKDTELPDTDGLSPIDAWKTIIERVEELAATVGGLPNLKKTLEVAASFAALTGK